MGDWGVETVMVEVFSIRLARAAGMWMVVLTMESLEIPDRCGVMLLPDCTLFPHGGLPLYIFERRYRKMLEDALEGDCLFAVGRLTGEETGDPAEYSAPVGTIGLVRASREQEDGTSQLLLHGVIRVRFNGWVDEREYPVAEIEPIVSVFEPYDQVDAAMKTLRGAVEDAVRGLPDEVQAGVFTLLDRADGPGLMTDIVSQQFVQDVDLRQRLLELGSVGDRIPLLCEYLRLASERADD
ncbi:MAG: LON peptidase substrate-binding domain-containing protein [Verrucomicrobiales bacterium]